jgi:hypothetical protein
MRCAKPSLPPGRRRLTRVRCVRWPPRHGAPSDRCQRPGGRDRQSLRRHISKFCYQHRGTQKSTPRGSTTAPPRQRLRCRHRNRCRLCRCRHRQRERRRRWLRRSLLRLPTQRFLRSVWSRNRPMQSSTPRREPSERSSADRARECAASGNPHGVEVRAEYVAVPR